MLSGPTAAADLGAAPCNTFPEAAAPKVGGDFLAFLAAGTASAGASPEAAGGSPSVDGLFLVGLFLAPVCLAA